MLAQDKKLAKHIKDSGLPDDTWLTKWYISLFTGYFSAYFSARFLDYIFSRDIFVLPVLTTAILVSVRKDLLARDMEGINDYFQSFLHLDDPKK